MDEKKLVHTPHVGPEPVEAKPNHVREKTYKAPDVPDRVEEETQALPEKAAEEKATRQRAAAVDEIKRRL